VQQRRNGLHELTHCILIRTPSGTNTKTTHYQTQYCASQYFHPYDLVYFHKLYCKIICVA